MSEDTIHALATAPGRAGVAVVRVSGPHSGRIIEALTRRNRPAARRAAFRKLYDQRGGLIDEALILSFEDGHSFTGEDTAEFQMHGGRAVVAAVLRAIEETELSRPALAGEFTRRALYNQRLDVTQVQGLGSLIDAETERQRKAAVRVLDGEIGDMVRSWRRDLLEAAAYLEATIDFAEEDVPENVEPAVHELLCGVQSSIDKQIQGVKGARRLENGFVVAIVGAPNAGKSSLLNALTRSDAAIVSDVPGTTRDVIEVRMEINGLLVRLLDTAGLRDTLDAVEQIGVQRARARARDADFRILVMDPTQDGTDDIDADLVVRTKRDIVGGFGVAAPDGDGIEDLIKMIGAALEWHVESAGLMSTARDEAALSRAAHRLKGAIAALPSGASELVAEDLRRVMEDLAEIIGDVDIENILDHIFGSFCIGK